MAFEVPLDPQGWFNYSNNLTFNQITGYPAVKVEFFDADRRMPEFLPLLSHGGIMINEILHPWIVIRAGGLKDKDCLNLKECVASLKQARKLLNGSVHEMQRGRGVGRS